jgi:hypothetical protein
MNKDLKIQELQGIISQKDARIKSGERALELAMQNNRDLGLGKKIFGWGLVFSIVVNVLFFGCLTLIFC